MPKQSKTRAGSGDTGKTPTPEPLIGREPTNPPRPNPLFLRCSLALFLAWLGVLIWLAMRS